MGRGNLKLTARGAAPVQAGGQVLRALSIVVESVGSAAGGAEAHDCRGRRRGLAGEVGERPRRAAAVQHKGRGGNGGGLVLVLVLVMMLRLLRFLWLPRLLELLELWASDGGDGSSYRRLLRWCFWFGLWC